MEQNIPPVLSSLHAQGVPRGTRRSFRCSRRKGAQLCLAKTAVQPFTRLEPLHGIYEGVGAAPPLVAFGAAGASAADISVRRALSKPRRPVTLSDGVRVRPQRIRSWFEYKSRAQCFENRELTSKIRVIVSRGEHGGDR